MDGKALKSTKKMLKEQVKRNCVSNPSSNFGGYQKVYFHTNENINFYMGFASLSKNTNALTVLGSGDHAFNLITSGVRNIDTFDLNRLTEYFAFGLKIAKILKYNYYEYLVIDQKLMDFNITLDELSDIIIGLIPYMDKKYRLFWRKVIDINYKLQKNSKEPMNLIYLICTGVNSPRIHNNNNRYLTDEAYYIALKHNLQQANLRFFNVNATDLADHFADYQYDLIFLSNIMDYFTKYYGDFWHSQIFRDYIHDLEKITKDGGTIFVNYIFDKFDGYTHNPRVIRDSMVFEEDLEDEFKVIEIPIYLSSDIIDGMVLKRVKKGK